MTEYEHQLTQLTDNELKQRHLKHRQMYGADDLPGDFDAELLGLQSMAEHDELARRGLFDADYLEECGKATWKSFKALLAMEEVEHRAIGEHAAADRAAYALAMLEIFESFQEGRDDELIQFFMGEGET
jgi:predicted HTH domain antitoxin